MYSSGYLFIGWKVTGNLNTSTAKWGTTSTPNTDISSSSTLCGNESGAGTIYFKNLNPTDGVNVTITAQWIDGKVGAKEYIEDFDTGCNCQASGGTDAVALSIYWYGSGTTDYSSLGDYQKYWIEEDGVTEDETILDFKDKYEYIATKYGLTDYIGILPESREQNRNPINPYQYQTENSDLTMIIIIISTLSVTFISIVGMNIYVKKRKSIRK